MPKIEPILYTVVYQNLPWRICISFIFYICMYLDFSSVFVLHDA